MIASNHDPHQKVQADHLQRDAYLYIRQSTLQQVFHNTESTQRQYALKQRAIALGWPAERGNIIDGDQGQSGASATDREGFQQLVAEVGMGRAGIVLGLEVSRLARNNCDWHRLLEMCGLTDTLILDEDGLYDPCNFNDRLLLGLKGAMRLVIARLKAGEGVCLFPEGTRTRDGRITAFKPGFGLLCRRSKAPVVPVLIDGAFECWPRQKKIFSSGPILLQFGKPLAPEQAKTMTNEQLVDWVTRTLRQMQHHARLRQGKPPYDYPDESPAPNSHQSRRED